MYKLVLLNVVSNSYINRFGMYYYYYTCFLDGTREPSAIQLDTGSYIRNQISFCQFQEWFTWSVRACKLMIPLSIMFLCDPPEGFSIIISMLFQLCAWVILVMLRNISYNVTSWSDNALCQMATVTCKVTPLYEPSQIFKKVFSKSEIFLYCRFFIFWLKDMGFFFRLFIVAINHWLLQKMIFVTMHIIFY